MQLKKSKKWAAKYIILESIAYTVVRYLYYPFIQIFAKRMGAGEIHIALLNSVPPLVAIFVLIPCGILIERINRKKKTVLILLLINSLFYASIAFVPMIPNKVRVITYIALIGLMNWPGSLYLSTVQSYLADNFNGSCVNRIISQRSKYGILFGLITVLITGLLLTEIPKTEEERLFMYQIFYAACFLLTLLELWFFSKINLQRDMPEEAAPIIEDNCSLVSDMEVPAVVTDKGSGIFSKASIKNMLLNKTYTIFCLCGFVFYLVWQMGWPLVNIYYIDYVGLNEFQLGLLSVVMGATQFLSYSRWNKLIDKKGCRLVIIFGAVGLAANPFFFTTRLSFAVILLIYVMVGISEAGFLLSLNCGLLEILPSGRNTVYISAFNTLINVSGFIAPLLGVWLYNKTNIYLSLGIIGVFRVAAVMLYVLQWRSGKKAFPESSMAKIQNGN